MASCGNKHTISPLVRSSSGAVTTRLQPLSTNEFVHAVPGPYFSEQTMWYSHRRPGGRPGVSVRLGEQAVRRGFGDASLGSLGKSSSSLSSFGNGLPEGWSSGSTAPGSSFAFGSTTDRYWRTPPPPSRSGEYNPGWQLRSARGSSSSLGSMLGSGTGSSPFLPPLLRPSSSLSLLA